MTRLSFPLAHVLSPRFLIFEKHTNSALLSSTPCYPQRPHLVQHVCEQRQVSPQIPFVPDPSVVDRIQFQRAGDTLRSRGTCGDRAPQPVLQRRIPVEHLAPAPPPVIAE